MEKLLLVSSSNSDLIVSLNLPKSTKAVTHRKDRAMPTTIKVPANGSINLVAELGMSKQDALDIIDSSPEVQRRITITRELVVVDIEKTRAVRQAFERDAEAQQTRSLLSTMIDNAVAGAVSKIRQDAYLSLAQGKTTQLSRDFADGRRLPSENVDPKTAPTASEVLEQMSGEGQVNNSEAQALEPGLADAISDATPSTKWSREKLAAYAVSKGLKIDADMSKNMILRKLRGVE